MNNSNGIKFESDDNASASSLMSLSAGNTSGPLAGGSSHYDAAEAAVAKLGSIMDGQRGECMMSLPLPAFVLTF